MNNIIKNYAHDYRDIPMSEEALQKMLESFLNEISHQVVWKLRDVLKN